MAGRRRHPNKHIEGALQYAESSGWRVEVCAAHAWGRMYCPAAQRDGCLHSVWSTPKHPEHFAKLIRRYVDRCDHS